MTMVFCRGCAKEIHETAIMCPQCGAVQNTEATLKQQPDAGSVWMAIVSLVLGIICILAMFDDSDWDKETITGLGLFSITGLVFGVISITKKKPGNGMAIAGIVLSALSLLIFLGMSV